MVSDRTRNIFDYLCAVLQDGLASPEDVRRFVRNMKELSEKETAFLEGAFTEDIFTRPVGTASTIEESSPDAKT